MLFQREQIILLRKRKRLEPVEEISTSLSKIGLKSNKLSKEQTENPLNSLYNRQIKKEDEENIRVESDVRKMREAIRGRIDEKRKKLSNEGKLLLKCYTEINKGKEFQIVEIDEDEIMIINKGFEMGEASLNSLLAEASKNEMVDFVLNNEPWYDYGEDEVASGEIDSEDENNSRFDYPDERDSSESDECICK